MTIKDLPPIDPTERALCLISDIAPMLHAINIMAEAAMNFAIGLREYGLADEIDSLKRKSEEIEDTVIEWSKPKAIVILEAKKKHNYHLN